MVSVLDEFLLNTAHREEFERSDDFQGKSEYPAKIRGGSHQQVKVRSNRTETSPDK